jgi:hypothetical protein
MVFKSSLNQAGGGGVTQIIAGTNVTISPSGGTGNVTINASGGGGGGITRSINSISTNTNGAAAASTDYVYFCTAALTFTLPTAVGNTNRYTVANQSTGTITFASAGGAINGNIPLTQQYMSYDFVSDGTNWNIC